MSSLNEMTITQAAHALRAHDISVRELWEATATVAVEKNKDIFAYLELFNVDDVAIATAQKRIDSQRDTAPLLCGIPLAIKDNILIKGKIASAASKMLENYHASYTATVITQLKEANALFLGRTNMDEFAMGSSTESSAFGTTKNPHDHTRVPGGSSGGSAAAVASHVALAALGSDTGGSIRQPASLCGLVGLKPTYGAVSRYGLIAMGSSLDQVGPLTKTVEDARALFHAIAGHDVHDATSIPKNLYLTQKKVPDMLRIGVPRALLEKGVDADVLAQFNTTLTALEAQGHRVVDIDLPASTYALSVYYIIMPAEASTNLSRLDGMRYGLAERGKTLLDDYLQTRSQGFGPEVQRRILLGTFVLSAGYIDAYYRKAHAARAVLTQEYLTAFTQSDVIAVPTSSSPAFRLGEKKDPVSLYAEDTFTVTANLTGMPAISVPMGTVEREGNLLPTGIHFTAPHQAEEVLFAAGGAVEKLQT